MTITKTFKTKSSNVEAALPLFIPVYRPDYSFELFNEDSCRYGLGAVMVNAFLLFKEQRLKESFEQGCTLREHIGGFGGMLCTDSGAFQQLSGRTVDIDPVQIVKFQNMIKTDIAAPLDLITPPDTSYDETYRRMVISQYRIVEALEISGFSDLAGIQQGGGYFSLRQKHIRQLAEAGIRYYGIGSMVPFFNKNHDLSFTCGVIKDAREVIGRDAPMHIYGAGDPLDIAFMYMAGADIFDSSSYAHYAQRGYYMTPYGAVSKRAACEKLGFDCGCPVCVAHGQSDIFDKAAGEALRKQHNLFVILDTMRTLRKYSGEGRLGDYVSGVYNRHINNQELFPETKLASSWEKYLSGAAPLTEATGHSGLPGDTWNPRPPRNPRPHPNPRPHRNHQPHRTPPSVACDALECTKTEKDLLEALADECAISYKMDQRLILELLTEEIQTPKYAGLRARINGLDAIKDVLRLREYKEFRKDVRARVYRELRQYKPSGSSVSKALVSLIECEDGNIGDSVDRLLESHVSTRERLSCRDEFVNCVLEYIEPGSTLIDIGCGFAPLLFPAEFFSKLSRYIAVDKDAGSTETVRVFAKRKNIANLEAYTWDISSGLASLRDLTGMDSYDTALMLKILPALNRVDHARNKGALSSPVMGRFPAARVLATVSRESMTKHGSIEKRELAMLQQFARTYELDIISDFSCGSEAGYYLGKEK